MKSEGHRRKEAKAYIGDDVLKRLGVFVGEQVQPQAGKSPSDKFAEFLEKVKAEHTEKYDWLRKCMEEIAKEDPQKPKGPKPTCERAMAEYLWELGKKVTNEFFKSVIIFVRLYRECLNENGWSMLRKAKNLPDGEDTKEDFASHAEAESIPDMCNQFVKYYLPEKFPSFDKYLSIELTRHMCNWVYTRGYTHRIISLL